MRIISATMSYIRYNAFVDKFKSKTSVWLQWRKNMILMLLHKIHFDNHRGSSHQSSLAVRFLRNYSEKGLRVCSLIAFKNLQNVKSEQMKKAKMTSGADFIMTLGLALGRLRLIPTNPQVSSPSPSTIGLNPGEISLNSKGQLRS